MEKVGLSTKRTLSTLPLELLAFQLKFLIIALKFRKKI